MKTLVVVVVLGCALQGALGLGYGSGSGFTGGARFAGIQRGGSGFTGGARFAGIQSGGSGFTGGARFAGIQRGGSFGGISGGATNFGGIGARRSIRVGGGAARFGGARRSFQLSSGGGFQRGGATIDVNNFANIDARSFGLNNFAPDFVNIATFDFDGARRSAASFAPRDSLVSGNALQQIVVGRRFRSGSARQTESSGALKEGSGRGEAGIELAASRSASQDATQQFTQTASGEGSTSQGAGYAFERNNNGQIRFSPVRIESASVHAGPRSRLPTSAVGYGGARIAQRSVNDYGRK
ncbi:PREDICTED: glycine, alanine and asparagine-rich protein-like [Priapulus caudatus]|uniref:Glycine, alanine and asparagine-rich protein-like n=1 Tax=Priapulus caudatus TaxID=37621 RepID=A0ABM1F3H1_PRICU|nr:PREDICTED: glycine, alanine and asparagine-rich protein-like [Priapulus caudatus]